MYIIQWHYLHLQFCVTIMTLSKFSVTPNRNSLFVKQEVPTSSSPHNLVISDLLSVFTYLPILGTSYYGITQYLFFVPGLFHLA